MMRHILLFLILAPASGWAQDLPSLSEKEKAIHVLDRLTFGPTPESLAAIREMGVVAFIEAQLQADLPEPVELASRLNELETLRMSPLELYQAFRPPGRREGQAEKAMDQADTDEASRADAEDRQKRFRQARQAQRRILDDLTEARLVRAIQSENQLKELMVDFWMNHFNVQARKGWNRFTINHFEYEVIRPAALGKFEDLLTEVARSPAMLFYLDNWLSSAPADRVRARVREKVRAMGDGSWIRKRDKKAPDFRERALDFLGGTPAVLQAKGLNENYARELLELHTLGVDSGYSQEDIIQVAKAFTGWTLTSPGLGIEFKFQPLMHEAGDKLVLGQVIQQGGQSEGEAILQMLANHPATARFISYKLAVRFVADQPPEGLVDAAARTFEKTGGDIREVLRTLFTSPVFFSPEIYQAKTRKPFELVAATVRAAGSQLTNARPLIMTMAEMGEILYNNPVPTGYSDFSEDWINTNSLLTRLNFALAVASEGFRGLEVNLEKAERLFQELDFTDPTEGQLNQTAELLAERSLGKAEPRRRVLSLAFQLGSPSFQKK